MQKLVDPDLLGLRKKDWNNSAAVPNNNPVTYRLLLVYDKQCNGALTKYTDLLGSQNAAGSATLTTILSPINLANRDRFLILRDKVFQNSYEAITPWSVVASKLGGQLIRPNVPTSIHWFIKLKGLETLYSTSSNSATSITSGSLFLMLLTDAQGNGGVVVPQITSRLRYYD